ncbi:MAG TPA: M48 family metalloprotease, partial [Acidimicrobiales bacterium]|nr:M48 family metalloprotease [Acidimicrobiales bacterium]
PQGAQQQQKKGQGQGGGGGGGQRSSGNRSGGQRSGGGGGGQRSSSGGGNRNRNRGRSSSGQRPRDGQGQPKTAVTLAPPAPPEPLDTQHTLGAPKVFAEEVAANRRRAIRLCAYTAAVPALLLFALLTVSVNIVAGIAALLVSAAALMYGMWRLSPRVALRRIGARPADEDDDPRLFNITEGLCATFGLAMPTLHILDDPVLNACALGRDARRADLVVTSGLLRTMHLVELEGVIAHELSHVKRGDNGVSCIGITLATLWGGEKTLRRCVGENREYRADVVGASIVRYPSGLLGALCTMMESPPPVEGSFFASPGRFGSTRWVWIDPAVGHREEPVYPGDLDATWVRAAALSEW